MFLRASLLAALVQLLPAVVGASPALSNNPSGFVRAEGTKFVLDGRPFYFAGTNSYWAQFTTNTNDIETTFERISGAGLKVVRTWGFNDANATFVAPSAGGFPQYSNSTSQPGDIIFQTWNSGKATINTGPTGLQHFDKLIALASQHDLKLIVTLTNNWADYGGMDVYTVNLGGQFHDDFFTSPRIKAAYKNYVKAIVTRYKDSPTIFAWELANEPRCSADPMRNLPQSPEECDTKVLTAWADEMAGFVKGLDPNHMVTLGDEGFFNDNTTANADDFAYNGSEGVDFVANLKLKNLDFGTFHLYPDSWSMTVPWSNQYIQDHITAMHAANKPVIMEEYGWESAAARLQNQGTVSNFTRVEVEGGWQKIAVENKLSGDMFWQFGLSTGLSTGPSPDDGFTIFLENTTESVPLIHEHVAAVAKLNL